MPGGEGYCLAEEGQGVHCGGWGRSGDGEAAAEEDGGAEGQHQAMEGGDWLRLSGGETRSLRR